MKHSIDGSTLLAGKQGVLKSLNIPQLMVVSECKSEEYLWRKKSDELEITRIDITPQGNNPSTRPCLVFETGLL